MALSEIQREGTTVKLTAAYLSKLQAIGWKGSTSIHPRVVDGRTKHKLVNTSAPRKKQSKIILKN